MALYDVMRYAFRAFASPEDLLSRLMDRVTVEGVEEQMRPLIKIRYTQVNKEQSNLSGIG